MYPSRSRTVKLKLHTAPINANYINSVKDAWCEMDYGFHWYNLFKCQSLNILTSMPGSYPVSSFCIRKKYTAPPW